jgi:hypothetical protein
MQQMQGGEILQCGMQKETPKEAQKVLRKTIG